MFWSNGRIFGTVKIKVVLVYAVLFAASSIAVFFLVYSQLKSNMLNQTDRLLRNYMDRLSYEYLTNNKFKRFDRRVSLEEIPHSDLAAFEQRIPGIRPLLAFKRAGQSSHYYTVLGHVGDSLYELRLESGGTVYARRIPMMEHLPLLKKTFQEIIREEGRSNWFFRLKSAEGNTIAQSAVPEHFPVEFPAGSKPGIRTLPGEPPFRIAVETLFDGSVLEAVCSLQFMESKLDYFSRSFIVALTIILCGGSLCSWLIARKFIGGVERINRSARMIARSGDFSKQLPVKHEGIEIDELVMAFNTMNAHTEKLLTELRHVTDDVAHDLRTPLTRMRGMAEVTVGGPQDLNHYREMACDIAEECSKMVTMINTMLEITKTESNLELLTLEPLNLNELLAQAHELYLPLAEEKGIHFTIDLTETPAVVNADKIKIQRMAANLIDNAIKFTPAGGSVSIALTVGGDAAELRFTDTGCGIPEKDLANIFKRFYRADSSRTLPGNGLGLSLVHAIVEAHKGSIRVESSSAGSVFFVNLPLFR